MYVASDTKIFLVDVRENSKSHLVRYGCSLDGYVGLDFQMRLLFSLSFFLPGEAMEGEPSPDSTFFFVLGG